MAHLHNFPNNHHPSLLSTIGTKVKQGAEIAGTIKNIFDIGRGIYQTVGPLIAAAAVL